jgi:hypothetical protein
MGSENPIFKIIRRKRRVQAEPVPVVLQDTEPPSSINPSAISARIEFEGRQVVVKNNFPLQAFISGLNEHDPGAEIFVRTRQKNFLVLWGGVVYPPSGICTDGEVRGVNAHFGVDTLDVSEASYLAWISTDYRPRSEEEDPPDITSEGSVPTYFMMSIQSMSELRRQAHEIPGNTIKFVNWR